MTKTEYEAYPRACESGSQFGRVIQKVFPDATQKFYRIGNKLNVTLKKGWYGDIQLIFKFHHVNAEI